MKNYKEYIDYCQRLAEDINDSYSDDIELNDRIHEIADGCQYVIYYSKAWELVNMMRECDYEKFKESADEVHLEISHSYDLHKLMTLIAYNLIRNGIHSAYQHIESEVAV